MENDEIKNLDIQGNYSYIISLIETSKSSTLKAINSELIILYWKIGEYIQKDILDKADKIYGENIVVGQAPFFSRNRIIEKIKP